MEDESYQKALEAVDSELLELTAQRDIMDSRIAKLKATKASLRRLFVEDVPKQRTSDGKNPGFTETIREILKTTNQPLQPTEVRDRVIAMGYDLSVYLNPLAAIHTILRRLYKNGEIHAAQTTRGTRIYSWKNPTEPLDEVVEVVVAKSEKKKV